MLPPLPDTYEKQIICAHCQHKWYETMQYEGHGLYYPTGNEELCCPECGTENEPG